MLEESGLGLQGEGYIAAWTWKNEYLVNRCLLGHAETQKNFNKQTLLGSFPSTHLTCIIVFYGDSSFLEQVPIYIL